MIDESNLSDQPIKNDKITYENIRKIATGQRYNYTTGCLLDYTYFKYYYKMVAIDLSKQQASEEFNRLILLQIWIEIEIQESFSSLRKPKKLP